MKYRRRSGEGAEALLAETAVLKERVAGDRLAMLEAHRVLGGFFYELAKYPEAAAEYRAGLEINPNDLELNNNVAYTLAKFLNDPKAALPFAQRAVQVASLNSAVLDTLGTVYIQLEQYREAEPVLSRAVDTATTPEETVPANLHLAQTRSRLGDPAGAKESLSRAKDGLVRARQSSAQRADTLVSMYQADIDALGKELDNAR
jgi:tetratricopeptide (TPR) repeat protein